MYRLGLYGEAQKHFLEAVAARPDFAPAFLNLGNVYFLQGDYDKAIAGYRSAVELDSTDAVAPYNLGQAYIKKMLFAQSGVWLERATLLGIETYRVAHPAVILRNPPVYEQDFDPRELWAVAIAEGKSRPNVLLSEVLQPYLLFPFHWLWVLLAASLIAAPILAWRRSDAWRTERCDNCGGATCLLCEDSQTGIRLCRDCAEVVRGLTSVKVMEALLRTRRQRMAGRKSALGAVRVFIFPGVVQTCYGSIGTGCALSLVNGGALGFLIWRGFYFEDPRSAGLGVSIWTIAAPAAILVVSHLLAYFATPPQETKNYRVLPPDLKPAGVEPAKRPASAARDPWEEYETARAARRNEGTRDSERARAPEPSERSSPAKKPSADKVCSGEIEKGTKWH